MYIALVILQVLVALALITLVLIQHGKGADAGAAFGSGASGTLFGARGSANFLSRTTGWLAAAFFAISLALAYAVHGQSGGAGSIVDELPAATTPVSSASVARPVAAPVLPAESTSAAKPASGETPAPKVPD